MTIAVRSAPTPFSPAALAVTTYSPARSGTKLSPAASTFPSGEVTCTVTGNSFPVTPSVARKTGSAVCFPTVAYTVFLSTEINGAFLSATLIFIEYFFPFSFTRNV